MNFDISTYTITHPYMCNKMVSHKFIEGLIFCLAMCRFWFDQKRLNQKINNYYYVLQRVIICIMNFRYLIIQKGLTMQVIFIPT